VLLRRKGSSLVKSIGVKKGGGRGGLLDSRKTNGFCRHQNQKESIKEAVQVSGGRRWQAQEIISEKVSKKKRLKRCGGGTESASLFSLLR